MISSLLNKRAKKNKSIRIIKWILITGIPAFLAYLVIPALFRISLDPASALSSTDPFKTPFVLQNTGVFPINSINISGTLDEVENFGSGRVSQVGLRSDGAFLKSLSSSEKTTVGFIPVMDFSRFVPIKSAVAELEISYVGIIWPFRFDKSFKFVMQEDAAGNLIWLPLGNNI